MVTAATVFTKVADEQHTAVRGPPGFQGPFGIALSSRIAWLERRVQNGGAGGELRYEYRGPFDRARNPLAVRGQHCRFVIADGGRTRRIGTEKHTRFAA